jgi:hypothetical protein
VGLDLAGIGLIVSGPGPRRHLAGRRLRQNERRWLRLLYGGDRKGKEGQGGPCEKQCC